MNKLFLVILAICLVSTHAFVKRDAPADNKGIDFDKVQKDVKDFFEKSSDNIKTAFDPETIKKSFNQFVDNVNSLTHKEKKA